MRTIKITSDGVRTHIVDAESGKEIPGIASAKIHFTPEGAVARLTMLSVETAFEGKARFNMAHPETGEFQEIRKIEFADGTVFDALLVETTSVGDECRKYARR